MSADPPSWVRQARRRWQHRGQARPPFAHVPGPGQESVWDYPRPPRVVVDQRRIEVEAVGRTVAVATGTVRVLETSLAPSFYLPPESVVPGMLVVVRQTSHCEWKGEAEYLALADPLGDGQQRPVGWRYPRPYVEFAPHAGWVSFYPDRVECRVDGEVARAQAGGFYGGWITADVVGPFKGEPGTGGW